MVDGDVGRELVMSGIVLVVITDYRIGEMLLCRFVVLAGCFSDS